MKLSKPLAIREPGSALTHFGGFVLSLFGSVFLLVKAFYSRGIGGLIACAVFALGLLLLYGASSSYHAFGYSEKTYRVLKKMDHMMICVLIAATYTPVCLLVIPGTLGYLLLGIIWGLAILGILFKLFWVFCPKWVSSVLYIGMGWTCIIALPSLLKALSPAAFGWLLAGGILYTLGGVLYALKLSVFNGRHPDFGSHEIFHLFVLAGSLCHFILIYFYVL